MLLVGDFSQYVITDRVGMFIEFLRPGHLLNTANNLPDGRVGAYAFWRVGADSLVDGAFRMLDVATSCVKYHLQMCSNWRPRTFGSGSNRSNRSLKPGTARRYPFTLDVRLHRLRHIVLVGTCLWGFESLRPHQMWHEGFHRPARECRFEDAP